MAVSFTIDLEDPLETYDPVGRYDFLTRRLLDLCDEYACKATFFTVGLLARINPALIKEIATRGHEVAYHSYGHVSLTEDNAKHFRHQARLDKKMIEDLSGQSLEGFRAPRFSLTPESHWVLDVLCELGFHYSSSVMPTAQSLFGYPGCPTDAFRWPNGLIEFPVPLARVGPLTIPYLGGVYLYTIPSTLAAFWARSAPKDAVLWTYTHPYDLDRDPKFSRLAQTPLWISLVLKNSRRTAERKLRSLLAKGVAPVLRERLNERNYIMFKA